MDKIGCQREGEIATLKAEMIEVKSDINRLDRIYDLIYGLTTSVSILTDQMERNNDELVGIKNDVNEIKDIRVEVSLMSKDIELVKEDTQIVVKEVAIMKDAPKKKLDWVWRTIVGIVISAITTFLLAQTFLG